VLPRDLTAAEAAESAAALLHRESPEVVFLALHGPFGEDGTIQRVCEAAHVAYTGSDPHASHLGMDKVASRQRFEQVGLSVPRWRVLDSATAVADESLRDVSLPVVVKPTNQGSSIGVTRVAHRKDLAAAIEAARRYDHRVLVEAWVQGRELTVGVLGDTALPVVEIRSSHMLFDYAAKYTAGQTEYLVPAPLEAHVAQRVQAAGLQAHRALGCRHFSRTDMILTEAGEPVVLEVNTIPGLTSTSLLPKAAACAGLSYDQLCEQMVQLAWQAAEAARPVSMA
jgi:D-alanine-D-alanine ligase